MVLVSLPSPLLYCSIPACYYIPHCLVLAIRSSPSFLPPPLCAPTFFTFCCILPFINPSSFYSYYSSCPLPYTLCVCVFFCVLSLPSAALPSAFLPTSSSLPTVPLCACYCYFPTHIPSLCYLLDSYYCAHVLLLCRSPYHHYYYFLLLLPYYATCIITAGRCLPRQFTLPFWFRRRGSTTLHSLFSPTRLLPRLVCCTTYLHPHCNAFGSRTKFIVYFIVQCSFCSNTQCLRCGYRPITLYATLLPVCPARLRTSYCYACWFRSFSSARQHSRPSVDLPQRWFPKQHDVITIVSLPHA